MVGYLFRPIGAIKRALFLAAAAGLLIPVVPGGNFASMTWATNGLGLLLAVALVGAEWLARGSAKAQINAPDSVRAPLS
jgi:hypothetical protein